MFEPTTTLQNQVLVVDGSESNSFFLHGIISNSGAVPVSALSQEEAISAIKSSQNIINLVLVEVSNQVVSEEWVKNFRAAGYGGAIAGYSFHATGKKRCAAHLLGFDAYIDKRLFSVPLMQALITSKEEL